MKKIGIFDSGIGGITLLREMISDYPEIEFYYVADDEWAPYGDKNDNLICERSEKIVNLLIEQKVEMVVVACNTATSLAIEHLRSKFSIDFVGVEPFINVLNRFEFDHNKDKIAVLTTTAMFHSRRFKDLLKKFDPEQKLHPLKVPQLATIIEQIYQLGFTNELNLELNKELSELKEGQYSHVILGCTHYPLIADFFKESLNIIPISPCPYVSGRVGNFFDASNSEKSIEHYWFMETKQMIWNKNLKDKLPGPLKF